MKFILWMISIFLMGIGLCFAVIYLNLLSFGMGWGYYFKYITHNKECMMFLIGLLLMIFINKGGSLLVWLRNKIK